MKVVLVAINDHLVITDGASLTKFFSGEGMLYIFYGNVFKPAYDDDALLGSTVYFLPWLLSWLRTDRALHRHGVAVLAKNMLPASTSGMVNPLNIHIGTCLLQTDHKCLCELLKVNLTQGIMVCIACGRTLVLLCPFYWREVCIVSGRTISLCLSYWGEVYIVSGKTLSSLCPSYWGEVCIVSGKIISSLCPSYWRNSHLVIEEPLA